MLSSVEWDNKGLRGKHKWVSVCVQACAHAFMCVSACIYMYMYIWALYILLMRCPWMLTKHYLCCILMVQIRNFSLFSELPQCWANTDDTLPQICNTECHEWLIPSSLLPCLYHITECGNHALLTSCHESSSRNSWQWITWDIELFVASSLE